MFRRNGRALALVGVVAAALVLAPGAALAKPPQPNSTQLPPPSPIATIKLSPGSGNPGATITALVACTQPTVAISIFMFSVPASTPGAKPVPNGTGYDVLLFNQQFNPPKPAGKTTGMVTIPAGLPAGTWNIAGACLYANDFESFGTTLIVPKKVFPPLGWGTFFPNLLFQGDVQIQSYFLGVTGALAPPPLPPPTTTTTTTKPRTRRTPTTSSTTLPTTVTTSPRLRSCSSFRPPRRPPSCTLP